jgi:L-asparaginase / beta-aspartyl-peptidase
VKGFWMQPMIIVHGGAGEWSDDHDSPKAGSLREAALKGWQILQAGGSALDAVEKAVNILEDFPLFDAGIGSYLNKLGEVEMDALIVDGSKHDFGAVAGVKHVRYPISLARKVMSDTPHCFFVGAGADALAQQLGFPKVSNLFFVTQDEFARFHNQEHAAPMGTVGAVAIDAQGHVAAATSTGGVPDKMPGRVGDSPLFGAGGYADNRWGGASATGVGENIMRVLLSKYGVDLIAQGYSAQEAADMAIAYINGYYEDSQAGIILVDHEGGVGAAHSTDKIAIAWIDANGDAHTQMHGGIKS